jgi:cullin 1
LAENSISDYLRLAEKRLKEEETRVDAYMHSQTRKPVRIHLIDLVALVAYLAYRNLQLLMRAETALVKDHQDRMQEEFGALLDADRQEGEAPR